MVKISWHFWVLCCLILFGCSSPRVITYSHANAKFDGYRTFNIKPHDKVKDISQKGDETFKRLDSLITEEMKNRGYQLSHNADIVIDYQISSGLSQNRPNQQYDRYSYWYYPSYSYNAPPQDVEAMVEIEMIDPRDKRTVWTGSADFTLKARRGDNVEKIEQHIVAIFNRFEYNAP